MNRTLNDIYEERYRARPHIVSAAELVKYISDAMPSMSDAEVILVEEAVQLIFKKYKLERK